MLKIFIKNKQFAEVISLLIFVLIAWMQKYLAVVIFQIKSTSYALFNPISNHRGLLLNKNKTFIHVIGAKHPSQKFYGQKSHLKGKAS
jgi:hypothetical protein